MTERQERSLTGAAKRLGLVALVAGTLVALLALLAPAASASPLLRPQTRVAAIAVHDGQIVGPSHSVLAVQGRERAPNYDSYATGSSVAAEGGAAAETPVPPGYDPDTWTTGPASRPSLDETHYYDPEGGEWRWHAPDTWHPDGHWDYKPPSPWNAPWQHIYQNPDGTWSPR